MIHRSAPRIAPAPLLAAMLALLLTGCGSDKEKEELLLRVAVAEAAVARAEAAKARAELAIAEVGNSEFADESEFVGDPGESGEEEAAEIVPDNQGLDNEIVAPPAPAPDPAPQGRMPA